MTSGLKRLYVHGFPSLYGGASAELHHRVILRRKMGTEVHLIPAWDCLRKQQVAEDDSAMAPTLYEYDAFGNFTYGYLAGSNLLEILTMPNDMTLTQSYEVNRDLLTDMVYKRGEDMVTHRSYSYDEIGRPTARGTDYPLKDIAHHDSFGYNNRSELTQAQLDDDSYKWMYDHNGNTIYNKQNWK